MLLASMGSAVLCRTPNAEAKQRHPCSLLKRALKPWCPHAGTRGTVQLPQSCSQFCSPSEPACSPPGDQSAQLTQGEARERSITTTVP